MKCPKCGSKMWVIDSRERCGGVYRRRECECGNRVSSYEEIIDRKHRSRIKMLYRQLRTIDIDILRELSEEGEE